MTDIESFSSTWKRWEHQLISRKNYGNPYSTVTLTVKYRGPDGQVRHGLGFWDGEDVFKIRFMFPEKGLWKWETNCSDKDNESLHGQSGIVRVEPYGGENRLYQNGYLKVSEKKRYLSFANGKPFIWLGDTSWLGGIRATQSEWENYVDDRKRKGFTVILLGCGVIGTASDIRDIEGNTLFYGSGESWNPIFWQGYDKKIQYANDCGIVIVVTGIMKRIIRISSEITDVLNFARNLAARLSGNFVIFSPDQDWGPVDSLELSNLIGKEIKNTSPYHLITQHTKRILEFYTYYHDQQYLDFSGLETGPGPRHEWKDWSPLDLGASTRYTVESITALYRRKPRKPVINLEGVYGETEKMTLMARRGGYLSFLSGAKGFTSGTSAIWSWGKPCDFWHFIPSDVETGIKHPYSIQMSYLRDFLDKIDWWRLEPDNRLIKNQSSDWTNHMILAKTPEGDLAAAYLPDNPCIEIDLSNFPGILKATWFHPSENRYEDYTNHVSCNVFKRPSGWTDAVLLLKRVK